MTTGGKMWQYSSILLVAAQVLQCCANAVVGNCLLDNGKYDFIVVGGGTAGLAFASRLSQKLPNDRILVLEAGGDGRDDQRIYLPGNKGSTLASNRDWNFTTVPQENVLGRIMPQNRGKVLGGSSAINLLTYDRGTIEEFNAWETLGNPGWNWDRMYRDQLLAEDFLRNASLYGEEGTATGGPIGTEIPRYAGSPSEAFFPVMQSLGLNYNDVSLAGNSLGYSWQPSSINGYTHRRSYSPDYLKLASLNLCVMPDAQVAKVLIQGDHELAATGVLLATGAELNAGKEVILSAGSLQSPGILELSGVGDSSVLRAAGVEVIHELPSVGENLQDHMRIQNSYQVRPGVLSSDELRTNATFRAEQLTLYNNSQPSLFWGSRSGYGFFNWDQVPNVDAEALTALAVRAVEADNTTITNQKLQSLIDPSKNRDVPQIELILSDGYSGRKGFPTDNTSAAYDAGFFTIFASLQHLFSHGSVHVTSTNVSTQARIDPNYLSNDYDFQVLLTAAKWLREIANTPPLKALWSAEYEPGSSVQTEADWETYVRNSTFSIYHPTGTCAMLPRENGGVVDPELRVYGVKNLRVVDASIIPLLVSGHIQSAVYGIAERAARIVAAEWN